LLTTTEHEVNNNRDKATLILLIYHSSTQPKRHPSPKQQRKMALVGKKPYPKATVKKIIKAHSDLNIKKNADVAVCPNPERVLPRRMLTLLDLLELRALYGNVSLIWSILLSPR
jgi:hypothetical protein